MKRGIIWGLLTCLIVMSLVLASCNKTTTTTTAPTSTTSTSTTTTTKTTTTTTKTTTTSTATTGKWYDSLGTPTYGGTLVERGGQNPTQWDPYTSTNGQAGYTPYLSQLWNNDYSVDPKVWDFSIGWLPSAYAKGYMMTSWEMPNPYTVVCHLRQDIYWQNIAPANGRQFVASDVVAHYNRCMGKGGQPESTYYVPVTGWVPLTSVVANDKFTVTFNWTPGTSSFNILTIMQAQGADNSIECPEAVAAQTTPSSPYMIDWRKAVGTGPFILTDFVDSTSATYMANPNYWGKDLRWPDNKLPYIDGFKLQIIVSNTTAEAAFRVGKIDSYTNMPVQDALAMIKTNPEIIVKQLPLGTELTLDPRYDMAPFNNLNVRIAMQHAIDIPTIAKTYYQGYATPWPASLTQNQMGLGGWGVAYPDWPDSTKAEYTYDPALAKKMLADAGFPNGFTTDCVLQTNNTDIDLYNIVWDELAKVGIKVNVQTMDQTSWNGYVLTSHKNTALCARNQGLLGFNFGIDRMLMRYGLKGYQTNYILVDDAVCQKAYADFLVAESVEAVQKILHDTNLYIATQHFAISLAQPSQFNMVQPWVKGNPGASTLGPAITGAGFADGVPIAVWIDQNLKKSLGH